MEAIYIYTSLETIMASTQQQIHKVGHNKGNGRHQKHVYCVFIPKIRVYFAVFHVVFCRARISQTFSGVYAPMTLVLSRKFQSLWTKILRISWAPTMQSGSTSRWQNRQYALHIFTQGHSLDLALLLNLTRVKRARKGGHRAGIYSACPSQRRSSRAITSVRGDFLHPTHDVTSRQCSVDVPTRFEQCSGGR